MATVIQAPYPAVIAQITLPNPELGDETNNVASLIVHTMQDGSIRTIIRSTGKKQRRLLFVTSEKAANEAADFMRLYSADKWSVNGTIYYFENTTLDLTYNKRAESVGHEDVSFDINLREA